MIPLEALDNRRLHLVVMPTEACQFRCTYCYEDFEFGRMPPGVVKALKAWMEVRAPELDLLQVSWFGGEPLLALDLLVDVQTHALELARRYPQMGVQATLTTNGARLTPETFRHLLSLRVTTYQITLDGPAETHDRTRIRADGAGTFALIWSHLLAMRSVQEDFSLLVRVHVHRDNLAHLPALLERCAGSFAGDRRFRVVFKALFHPGQPDFDARTLLEPDEIDACLAGLRSRAVELGLADPATAVHGGDEGICYAAKANSFVVRSSGSLGKCSVALSAAENQVGRLNEDGTVTIDAERMQHWMRGLFSGSVEERRCPLNARPIESVAAG